MSSYFPNIFKIVGIIDTGVLIIANLIENDKHEFSRDIYGQCLQQIFIFMSLDNAPLLMLR